MSALVAAATVSRASFMTLPMWFVWLLRTDIRGLAEPSDVKAQREFISWWLLWAGTEYPAVFSWNREHAGIAMKPVELKNGLLCPRLLVRLYDARQDLRDAFRLDDHEGLNDYFCWYRLHAVGELAAAPALPKACLAATEEPSERQPWCLGGTRVPRIATALARSFPHLLQGSIDDSRTRRALTAWYLRDGHCLVPRPSPPASARSTAMPEGSLRRDGVNLIGFVNGQSGLGEDIRMISAAFSAVGVPHVLIDGNGEAQRPGSPGMKEIAVADRAVFATSIYCMSAFDMATLYLKRGPAFFMGQYRIGYWPWELPRFPDIWTEVYELVDEIWTGSEFTASAYRANSPRPVNCLPAPVVLPAVKRHALAMIEKGAFVFTYPFDPRSYLARKNPIALVRAFHLAFLREDRGVALILRVNGTLPQGSDRAALFEESGTDRRIVILEGTLERAESLAVTASCDCLVSPHRAEGFGRNIAEAIVLGVPVLATAYSGCQDFLAADERIAFNLQEVVAGQYPFGDGQLWAEPVIADIAAKMSLRQTATRRHPRGERKRLASRAAQFAANYSAEVTGRAFADRLRELRLLEECRKPVAPAVQAGYVRRSAPGRH